MLETKLEADTERVTRKDRWYKIWYLTVLSLAGARQHKNLLHIQPRQPKSTVGAVGA